MLTFIFLPACLVCAYFALENVLEKRKSCKEKLKWILIYLILSVPSILIITLLGTIYVIYAGCRKTIFPGWTEKKLKLDFLTATEFRSGDMRLSEILFESNPQAILGK